MQRLFPILILAVSFAAGVVGFILWQQNQPKQLEVPTLPDTPREVEVPANLLKFKGLAGTYRVLNPDGRLRLLYFGFTNCPDVCPTSLAMLAMALDELTLAERAQLLPVFISLDPERDTPEILAQYTGYFDSQIVGLTPHPGQLKELARLLTVYYQYIDMPDSAMEYSVDHSSYFYLLDDQGKLLKRVPHTLTPEPIVEAIRNNLAKAKEDTL